MKALTATLAFVVFGCGTRTDLQLPEDGRSASSVCRDLAPSGRFVTGYEVRFPPPETNGVLESGDYELYGFAVVAGRADDTPSAFEERSGRMVVDGAARVVRFVFLDHRGGKPRRSDYSYSADGPELTLSPLCGDEASHVVFYTMNRTGVRLQWRDEASIVEQFWSTGP